MKNSIKKFVIACAAVTAVTAAFSVSALAAELDVTKDSYDAASNSVSVALPGDINSAEQATVLVFKGDDLSKVTDADIIYINQTAGGDFDEKEGTTEELKLMAPETGTAYTDGTYTVAIGYTSTESKEFALAEGSFTLGAAEDDYDLIGDANGDGVVGAADSAEILKYVAQKTNTTVPQHLDASDTNDDGVVGAADSAEILKYVAQKTNTTVDGTSKVNTKKNHVSTAQ